MPLLFSKFDLRAILEGHAKKARELILSRPSEQIAGEAGDAFIVELEKEYRVKPLRLIESGLLIEAEETKVDVRQDPWRAVIDRSRPCYVPGQRVRYIVPLEGDPTIWQCRPSTFGMNPPRARIEEAEVVFQFEVPNDSVPRTKEAFDAELSNVKQWIQYVDDDVAIHNQSLAKLLHDALAVRRQQLQQAAQQIQDIGIPIRKRSSPVSAAPAPANPQTVRKRTTPPKSRRLIQEYDVALSFAGENREYVEEVATVLRASGIKVFYDKFETVQLWGRNLPDHLGEIYGKKSRFVVMFISQYYPQKAWPTHERQSAQARAIKENKVVLLPVRFDDTEIPGLPASTAYVDLRKVAPTQLAEMIQQKLAE